MKLQHIKRNMARCKVCGDVLESKHVHDYVSCKCGAIAIDGGTEYLRRTCQNLSDIEELSEFEEIEGGY